MNLPRLVFSLLRDVVLVITLVLILLSLHAKRKIQRQARNWPQAHGTIEGAEAEFIEGRPAYWVGQLSYSYVVDGEYYSGFCQLPAANEDQAREAVRGWEHRKVTVRYRPQRPSVSVLLVDEQGIPGSTLPLDQSPC